MCQILFLLFFVIHYANEGAFLMIKLQLKVSC